MCVCVGGGGGGGGGGGIGHVLILVLSHDSLGISVYSDKEVQCACAVVDLEI